MGSLYRKCVKRKQHFSFVSFDKTSKLILNLKILVSSHTYQLCKSYKLTLVCSGKSLSVRFFERKRFRKKGKYMKRTTGPLRLRVFWFDYSSPRVSVKNFTQGVVKNLSRNYPKVLFGLKQSRLTPYFIICYPTWSSKCPSRDSTTSSCEYFCVWTSSCSPRLLIILEASKNHRFFIIFHHHRLLHIILFHSLLKNK